MSYLSLGGAPDDDVDFMSPSGGRGAGSGNSALSSLFGLNSQMNNNPNSNQSLTYTAPKPPGKSPVTEPKQPQGGGGAPGVAFAVAVTAYRYVNNQNVKHGKLGVAILKNVAAKDYKILMYVTKQKPVSTAQISPSFQFLIQANNYATFCDDQQQTWTVLFDSTQQLNDFAKQICLAKFFSSPQPPSDSIIQDLTVRDQQLAVVETGDSLEMKYTGWLVNADGTLGGVFDSNHNSEKTFRFKTGRGKVIKGWESGMLGMQKGGKRFLIIPPHLAYGQKSIGNRVPANSTLSFEVDLLRVKQNKDNSSIKSGESVESLPHAVASDTPPPNPVLPQVESVQVANVANDADVKGRTASLTDHISHLSSDGTKNPLVSRMARMGHAMLPVPGTEHKDPVPTPEQAPPPVANMAPIPNQPVHQQAYSIAQPTPTSYNQPLQQSTLQQPVQQQPVQPPQQLQPQFQHSPLHQMQQPQPQTVMTNNLQQPMMSQYPPMSQTQSYMDQSSLMSSHIQPTSDPTSHFNAYPGYRQMSQFPTQHGYGSELLPILVSESRQQSSELRLLQEKVDKVSGLVLEVKKNTSDVTANTPQLNTSQTMDATLIMHNIQRIMQENEHMKQTVLDKNKQIESQNEKIRELLQQNQKHVEKSNMMLEQRNDSFKESFDQSQARSLQLEQDKVDLTQRLSDATSKVSELTQEMSNAKQRESDLKQKFKEIYMKEKERAEEAEERVKELEEQIFTAEENEKKLVSSDSTLKAQIIQLKQEVSHLTEGNDKLNKEGTDNAAQWLSEKADLERKVNENKAMYAVQIEEMKKSAVESSSIREEETQKVTALRAELVATETRLNDALEQCEVNETKIEAMQQRYGQVRNAYQEQNSKLQQAVSEVEEANAYKEAYEKLRTQATSMKEKYEARIVQLQESLSEKAAEEKDTMKQAKVVDEIKKMMNTIFQRVRSKISVEEEYAGSDVIKIMLEIIKSTTLSLMGNKQSDNQAEDDEKEDSSDESEEDESEEDESEEESDEPAAEVKVEESNKEEIVKESEDPPEVEEKRSPRREEVPQTDADSGDMKEDIAFVEHEEDVSKDEESIVSKLICDNDNTEDPTVTDKTQEPIEDDIGESRPDEMEDPPETKNEIEAADSDQVPDEEMQPQVDNMPGQSVQNDAGPAQLQTLDPDKPTVDEEPVILEESNMEEVPEVEKESNIEEVPEVEEKSNMEEVPEVEEESKDSNDAALSVEGGDRESTAETGDLQEIEQDGGEKSDEETPKNTSSKKTPRKEETPKKSAFSDSYDRKPPPLFDDDTDDDDLNWLN